MAIVKSQAETGKNYVALQAAVYPGNILHVQGLGLEGNRKYGIAVNVGVNDRIYDYFATTAPTPLTSAAQTSRKYTEIALRPRVKNGTLHFQVQNGKENRSYGLAFDLPKSTSPELFQWALEQLAADTE